MLFPSFFNAGPATYEIEHSLRFNGSDNAYLINSTPSTDGNRKTYTISVWVKKVANSGTGGDTFFFATADSNYAFTSLSFGNADAGHSESLRLLASDSGASQYKVRESSTAAYRDYSAWMHVVAVMDTTQSTAANRAKIYVNGEQITDLAPAYTEPAQDYVNYVNGNNAKVQIGRNFNEVGQGPWYFDGYLAEYHLVDGTALDPTSFGEYDDNGVWRPKRYTGTYGTNGFYLKFDPSATNGIGHDHSGNGNHFTPTGFDTTNSTASTYDVMSDTPTTNWCTLNPISNQVHTLSNGNLDIASAAGNADTRCNSTIAVSSGKWYYEVTLTDAGTNSAAGIGQNQITNAWPGNDSLSYAYGFENAVKANNGSSSSYGSALGAGDVFMCAFDLDNNKIFFGKNGTWFDSSDPAAGTNSAYTLAAGAYCPVFRPYELNSIGASFSCNFGQRAFAYTPPTNFLPLNTSNLPAPTIKDGSKYFNTVLYTGTGANLSITGVGFQPDWNWIKKRSASEWHAINDAVRGAGLYLSSNTTNAENSASGVLNSFDSDGFTVGTQGIVNDSGATYVAWNWLAGNGTSSNTDGSITSTVSANPSAGFSIVSYTGTGSAATVGHGLGVAAKMIIVKRRTSSSNNWYVYHEELGNTKALSLNTTGAASTANFWNNTSPTSTVFNLGNLGDTNLSSMIAYCFAEVEGYSKFGIYRGNSNSDGPFAFCGFKPRWLMIKSTSAGGWFLFDTERDRYNVSDASLQAELASAESSSYLIDILSNGFKIRTTNTSLNYSVYDYIFAAFAENSFGGSGVSPATAR